MQLCELPKIEKEAIELLLQGDEMRLLRQQLDAVANVRRTESGAGVYVIFEFDESVEPLKGKESFHVADVIATSPDCEDIEFILFVKEGVIEYMESYVYSDAYPPYEGCNFSLSRTKGGGGS